MSSQPLYGAQTKKAISNFPISGRPMDHRVIRALAEVKAAVARTNASAGVLTQDIATAIEVSALAIARGDHADQFPVDTFQTGSGTSTNMNVNEVIASVASRASGIAIHPNDHVNASQSSNDVFPTAVHVAVARAAAQELLPVLTSLASALAAQAEAHADSVKPGRTHLMDAVPVTLGQEFGGYAAQVRSAHDRIEAALSEVRTVPLGGTAVGTGLNTPRGFRSAVVKELARLTGLALTVPDDAFAVQSARDGLVHASATLRGLAIALTKICNDLRWMASGPETGLAEITLPALQAGSSIMPGKVNPVIPEAVLQVCSHVIGKDTTVAWAGASGSFELNVQMPVMADALLDSISLLARACDALEHKCVSGITANTERMARQAAASPALVTALNGVLGYERGSAVVAQAAAEGIAVLTVVERLVASGELSAEALTAMDPLRLARPHDDRP